MAQGFPKDFIDTNDLTKEQILQIIDLSIALKKCIKNGYYPHLLQDKTLGMIFQQVSTRTRISFETAMTDLGGHAQFYGPGTIQLGGHESIEDTARVLGRFYDGIEFRGFDQADVEELAAKAGVPVWNGLTDAFHPTQMLADILTVKEEFGDVRGRKLTFFGDARNNVANSLMVVCAKLGMHFCACGPKELMPAADLVEKCKAVAAETGATIEFTDDPKAAAKDADVLYTDIWVSMGEPAELWAERIKELKPFQVNSELMGLAHKDAIFMHCLPSFHDTKTTIGEDVAEKFGIKEMEVTDEVFESSQSKVFDEAENRMHTIKAVMYATLK